MSLFSMKQKYFDILNITYIIMRYLVKLVVVLESRSAFLGWAVQQNIYTIFMVGKIFFYL